MSAKTSTAQPPGRRTPLSLNASTKQTNKPTNNKNDNNKKETNSYNNQKTDNSKKDSQPEKKNLAEKKLQSTDARKPSTEAKKADEVKTSTANSEESKKSQNGVSTNGVKDKEKANTNDGAKSKPETSGTSTPKKDSQKSSNDGPKSRTDASSVGTPSKKDSQKAAAEKKEDSTSAVAVKETKKEDNKVKEKEKAVEEGAPKSEEKESAVENKTSNETTSDAKQTETANSPEKVGKDVKDMKSVEIAESKKESLSTEAGKVDEEKAVVETNIEESSKVEENQVPEQSADVEMEPLTYEDELSPHVMAASTPAKPLRPDDFGRRCEVKMSSKVEVKPPSSAATHTPDRKNYPRNFSSISGRRSIRPIGDYSYSGNLQIRESYRKINTELDFTSSSLNVTVGSEVPNNDSFSFFSRSRKRDRSSPSRQSAMEVQGDISPKSPKRARIESGMAGFLSAMASPITALRTRLARTTVQSTPKKQLEKPLEDDVVENVSGISVNMETTATEDPTMNAVESSVDYAANEYDEGKYDEPLVSTEKPTAADVNQGDDAKCQEAVAIRVVDPAKKKCSIM